MVIHQFPNVTAGIFHTGSTLSFKGGYCSILLIWLTTFRILPFIFFARVGLEQAFPKQCRLTPNLIFHCWQARHLLHFQRQMIPRVQMYKSQARPCYNTLCICTGVSELPNKSSHSVFITASGGAGLHMDHGKWKPHRCWSVTSTLKNGVGRPRSALAGWWASET